MRNIIIICMLFILAGCNERLADPREMLIKSPADWILKYGDNEESRQTANIVLAIQVINRQAEAIKDLDGRLAVLEDPNNLLEKRVSKLEKVVSPSIPNPTLYWK